MARTVEPGTRELQAPNGVSNGFVNRRSGFRSPAPAQGSYNLEILAKKLDQHADRSGGEDACWPWLGGLTDDGYGRLYAFGLDLQAHRVALEVKIGRRLNTGEVAMHGHCDNPPCCNPAHLEVGTKALNNSDCAAKARTCFGERNASARLTAAQVFEIRERLAGGYRYGLYTEIARKYGVSSAQIGHIASGRRWGRVTEPSHA